MRSPTLRSAVAALLLAAATAAAAGRLRAARDQPYDVDVVPPAAAARWLSLGRPLLASHYYWLKTVQYVGDARADQRGWDRLLPLVDLVTDLDPGHGYAYQVAGVVLASAHRVEEANRILEKGSGNVKDRYILPYLRAFNAFYHQDDWVAAGEWAEKAAHTPGAPAHVRQNVLAYYVKGERADAAIDFLEGILAETRDPESRKAVEAQLAQARFEQLAGPLDAAIRAYAERYGGPPVVLQSLVADGLVRALPSDPFGGELVIGPDGRVRSTAHAFRFSPRPSAQERADPFFVRPTP